MARIALIKCSLPPKFNLLVTPPLGILSLASVLRRKGHRVMVLDARLRTGEYGWIKEELESFAPDLVGLSSLTQESDSMGKLALLARMVPTTRWVVAGGPHPSAYPEETLAAGVDFGVEGEGEETMAELVSRLEAGASPLGIPGVWGRDDGRTVGGSSRSLVQEVDFLPLPAWDLIDLNQYARAKRMGNLPRRKYAALITSRGCPYQCAYCHRILGKKFRPHSPERVLEEIEYLRREWGIEEFEVVDDIFNLDRERVGCICELLLSRKYRSRLAFPNGLRGDLLDREILGMLKKSGTYFIAMAVETASPRLQKLLRKNLDLDRVAQAARDCRELGITTLGFFMLGFPGETREELESTVDWAVRSPFDFASFFLVSPVRGTDMYNWREGRPAVLSPEAYQELDYHDGLYNLSRLPDREFFRFPRRAYRRFYLSRIPSLIWRGSFRRVAWRDGVRHFLKRAGFGKA